MARTKKASGRGKKNNKRKAPEPPAGAAADEAGPSVPPAPQATTSPAEGALQPSAPDVQGQTAQDDTLETRRKTALALLLNLGLPEERILRALEATAEDHSTEAETWAEEAGVWLAVDNECADESYVMGAAMEISLVEAEERKATEKPLVEQTGKEVIEKFANSELLDALRHAFASTYDNKNAPSTSKPEKILGEPEKEEKKEEEKGKSDAASNFLDEISKEGTDPALKQVLVDYLLMEQRCKKWYACSRAYFARNSENLQIRIEEIIKKKKAVTSTKDEIAEVGQATEGAAEGIGAVNNVHSADSIADISECLISSLTSELAVLEEAVFKLPENDNAGPPSIFAAYIDALQEEVDLVDG